MGRVSATAAEAGCGRVQAIAIGIVLLGFDKPLDHYLLDPVASFIQNL